MSDNIFQFYEFGDFKIDSRRRILSKNNSPVPISSKNLDLLLYLVKNEGRVLSHDELLDSVWEGTFVEQSNLKKGISAIRQVLGETPESSLFIKTIPRKGYSFVSLVNAYNQQPTNQIISATEVIIEEEIIEDDEPISAPKVLTAPTSQMSFWQQYNKYLIGGLAVLILGILAFNLRGYFTPKGKRFSVENVKISKITSDGNCYDASISADGNFILCGTFSNEGNGLMTRQVSANSQIQIVPPQRDVAFWAYRITPDGDSVYYILNDNKDAARSGLYQISFLGGNPRKISDKANGGLTFSPDNKKLAFVRIETQTNKIVTMNLDGSEEKVLTEYGLGHRIWGLNWSPDGKSLLCSARLQNNEKIIGFVDEISSIDGAKQRIFDNDQLVVSATWMPDKTSIILGLREPNSEVRQIWQYFPASKELIRVTNDNNTYRFPVLNQAGTIISVSQERGPSGIFQGEIGTKELIPIMPEGETIGEISQTKDGRIIYASFESGNEAVWIMKPDGTNRQQITDGKDGIGLTPKLSNDGNSIIYSSLRSGIKELWRVNFDGSGLMQLTKSVDETIFTGKTLSDSTTLIGISSNKNGYNIWKQNSQGEKTMIAEKVGFGWDVSPDDKLLVYDKYNETSKQSEVIVQSLENNQILHSFPAKINYVLKWNDSNAFVYETTQDGKIAIFKQTLDKKPPTLIFEHSGRSNELITNFILQPDNKKFLLIRRRLLNDAVMIKLNETK